MKPPSPVRSNATGWPTDNSPKPWRCWFRKFISQLPNDVISGEPYKYHRTADGQFVLYSVGWNETDDGGVPGQTLFDDKQGDWVWRYPAK